MKKPVTPKPVGGENNVLPFVIPEEGRRPLTRKPRDYNACPHHHAEVDIRARTLECTDCGANVDPLHFLLTVVAEYEERDYKYQKIVEFEEAERAKAEKRNAKRISAKS